MTLTVDDWIQAQEVQLRQPAARAAALAEVAPAASSRREKEFRGQRQAAGAGFTPRVKTSLRRDALGRDGSAVNGARHSQRRKPVDAPRLRYQHGQFVRQTAEGRA